MNWMCSSDGEYDEINTKFWWRDLFWNTDTCRSETFKTVFKAEGTSGITVTAFHTEHRHIWCSCHLTSTAVTVQYV